jgi:MoxR-like ATPase
MSFRKHELVVIARVKGWKGSESRLPREYFEKWLADRQVSLADMTSIVRAFRSGGISQSGQQQASVPSLSRADVADMIESAVDTKTAPAVDIEFVKKAVTEAVAKMNPAKIVVSENGRHEVKIEGAHPVFEKVLKLVAAGVNVLLVGPAGCGKTFLAHNIAEALKREFGMLSCTSGASESQLTGWLLPVGEGKKSGEFTYVPSEFVRMYENGNAVFLFDEFDAADPNMLLVMNSALANGSLHVPQRHNMPLIKRGKKMAMIAAANTYGSGSDMVYAGRNQLDAATLDRFYVVEMGYDKVLEQKFAPKEVCEWAWNLRERVASSRLRRVISTRMIQKIGSALSVGISFADAKKDMLAGWTRDELVKVGEQS